MKSLMALLLVCSMFSMTKGVETFMFPDELTDNEAIANSLGDLEFDFSDLSSLPSGSFPEFDGLETSFLVESSTTFQKAEPETTGKPSDVDEPVVCETVCKPLGGAPADSPDNAPNTASVNPTSFLQVDKKICHSKGGKWNDDNSDCEDFMQASKSHIAFDGDAVFQTCQQDVGTDYVPCNPYQALALAHLYSVPDHSYYWLWSNDGGVASKGNSDKAAVSHTPAASGVDKCGAEQHLGFFHNWDEAHVDSWGCLHDSMTLPVLCCRRR